MRKGRGIILHMPKKVKKKTLITILICCLGLNFFACSLPYNVDRVELSVPFSADRLQDLIDKGPQSYKKNNSVIDYFKKTIAIIRKFELESPQEKKLIDKTVETYMKKNAWFDKKIAERAMNAASNPNFINSIQLPKYSNVHFFKAPLPGKLASRQFNSHLFENRLYFYRTVFIEEENKWCDVSELKNAELPTKPHYHFQKTPMDFEYELYIKCKPTKKLTFNDNRQYIWIEELLNPYSF
ncbi:MAG: hypothetical protein LBR09_01875 [Endomicrobium sp.]|nr:hypothetical protein [Endomicrobium sp.]